jgi:hypothetical protein
MGGAGATVIDLKDEQAGKMPVGSCNPPSDEEATACVLKVSRRRCP